MRALCIVFLTLLAFGCGKPKETTAELPAQDAPAADSATVVNEASSYRFEIIEAPEKTFGYDVYKNDAMFIHQPHIPGMPGVRGFDREDQAKKAAELMIGKMQSGVIPPTLSEDEIEAILKN